MTPPEADWLSRFEAACTRHAASVALEIGGRHWRYAELHDWTLRLAALVGQHRRGERLRVGLLAARSLTATAGALAVQAAGCTLLALHPSQPPARLRAACRQAGVSLLIVGDEAVALLPQLFDPADAWRAVIAPESTLDEVGEPGSETAWHDRLEMDRPAPWLLPPPPAGTEITSLHPVGHPAGEPRAVALAAAGQAFALARLDEIAPLRAGDRVASAGETAAERGYLEAMQAWCHGATLQLLPDTGGPADLVSARSSVLRIGSALAAPWARSAFLMAGCLPALRQIVWSGEPLTAAAAQAWAAAAPQAELIQTWGSTETGGIVLVHRWQRGRSERDCLRGLVPLGEPVTGHRALLRGDDERIVAGAGRGELLVQGPQLSPGDGPLGEGGPRIELEGFDGGWHRSGLEAERDALGRLHAVRRRDGRLFPRGHRAERDELERAVAEAAEAEPVCILIQPGAGSRTPGLVAFIASREPPATIAQRLRERLPQRLPRVWLPDEIRVLRQLPLDAARQVDRAALALSLGSGEGDGPDVRPSAPPRRAAPAPSRGAA